MTVSHSTILNSVIDAGPVVKSVMILLLAASVFSWSFILQRIFYFLKIQSKMRQFEQRFWSGDTLDEIFKDYPATNNHSTFADIFTAGYNEYKRLDNYPSMQPTARMKNIERAMRVAANQQIDSLQQNLNFLATVGSVSPYVGLFGTVWGIMTAFTQLSGAKQATIAMVAPGISEALIATAFGLFAAIPAVIAFNRFTHKVTFLSGKMDDFCDNFLKILHRDIHA
jgi:biopolymer transport protein TolQ